MPYKPDASFQSAFLCRLCCLSIPSLFFVTQRHSCNYEMTSASIFFFSQEIVKYGNWQNHSFWSRLDKLFQSLFLADVKIVSSTEHFHVFSLTWLLEKSFPVSLTPCNAFAHQHCCVNSDVCFCHSVICITLVEGSLSKVKLMSQCFIFRNILLEW